MSSPLNCQIYFSNTCASTTRNFTDINDANNLDQSSPEFTASKPLAHSTPEKHVLTAISRSHKLKILDLLLLTVLNIQYNTKFVKRHVAVASEALNTYRCVEKNKQSFFKKVLATNLQISYSTCTTKL